MKLHVKRESSARQCQICATTSLIAHDGGEVEFFLNKTARIYFWCMKDSHNILRSQGLCGEEFLFNNRKTIEWTRLAGKLAVISLAGIMIWVKNGWVRNCKHLWHKELIDLDVNFLYIEWRNMFLLAELETVGKSTCGLYGLLVATRLRRMPEDVSRHFVSKTVSKRFTTVGRTLSLDPAGTPADSFFARRFGGDRFWQSLPALLIAVGDQRAFQFLQVTWSRNQVGSAVRCGPFP